MELAAQRKSELKDELRDELATKGDLRTAVANMKDVMATKEDIGTLRTELVRCEARLDRKFTVLGLVTIFSVIVVNQNVLEFAARLAGLVK